MTDILGKWTVYDTIGTILGATLNNLQNTYTVLSDVIDFTASPCLYKQYMDLEIFLYNTDWTSSVNPCIYLWLLPRTDGTNFEPGTTGSPGIIPARQPNRIVPVRSISGDQRVWAKRIPTTPDQAKILFLNLTGVPLQASNNTVKYYTYGVRLV